MENIKPIQTIYNGYRFRSRLEARWAVFFDFCGVKWEYEPEGYYVGDGYCYLPDFLLHDVFIVHGHKCLLAENLWVEVKGHMTLEDEEKIMRFSPIQNMKSTELYEYPIYIVGNIPSGISFEGILHEIIYSNSNRVPFFNFLHIDGDFDTAIPCLFQKGFGLFSTDYLKNINELDTMRAINAARQARFEHGEKGYPQQIRIEPNNKRIEKPKKGQTDTNLNQKHNSGKTQPQTQQHQDFKDPLDFTNCTLAELAHRVRNMIGLLEALEALEATVKKIKN